MTNQEAEAIIKEACALLVANLASHKRVQEALKQSFSYIFENLDYPGIPKIKLHTINDDAFVVGDMQIQPINVLHYKLPVKAFRVGNFSYITDANFISPEEKQKIKGSEVIVINALRRNEHISHFTFNEAIDLANELKAKKTYFTHISHQLGLHSEVSLELPDHIELGYDGLQIEVN